MPPPLKTPAPLHRTLRILALAGRLHLLALAAPGSTAAGTDRPPVPTIPAGPPPAAWSAAHDCRLSVADGALHVEIRGEDPYFTGPPLAFPSDTGLWMVLEASSDTGGGAQVFPFQEGPSEERSVRFFMPSGPRRTVRVPLPALGPGVRLRLDPPGNRGRFILHSLTFEPRVRLDEPDWPTPGAAPEGPPLAAVTRGALTWELTGPGWGRWQVRVQGKPFARAHDRTPVGYLIDGQLRWMVLDRPEAWEQVDTEPGPGPGIRVTARFRDPDGATWTLTRETRPSEHADTLATVSTVSVDAGREVVFLPVDLWLPGAGSFGPGKSQALFAGVEYLADEESSSRRAHRAAGADRRVPDPRKWTFPLMALAAGGQVLGFRWEPDPALAALHDSPDRVFGSGGHLWAVMLPGADPAVRMDGALLPHAGRVLEADRPVSIRTWLTGGPGDDILPALRASLQQTGLPDLPSTPPRDAYLATTARAWLDSPIRDGARYRHAVGPGFHPQAAADAAVHLRWLAERIADPGLAHRLAGAADEAAAAVPEGAANESQIGHIRTPLPALVLGGVRASLERALERGTGAIQRFRPDGTVAIGLPESLAALAETHGEDHANGFTGSVLVQLLRDAVYTADPGLAEAGLRILRQHLGRAGDVPRGAQPWEIPLHAPDILASAHWVEAFVLGHELTGDPDLLREAVRWAWTALPFIGLRPALDGPVGPYATIAVLGATHFVAPDWIGLPVQWCGLVHAHALRQLADHDPGGPWLTLADGITRSAIRQLHADDNPALAGLLPDSYDLRGQHPNPVPINPATLFPLAVVHHGEPPLLGRHHLTPDGPWIHAPGTIEVERTGPRSAEVRVRGWPRDPHHVVVAGLPAPDHLTLDGRPPAAADHEWVAEHRWLVLRVQGPARLAVRW